MSRTIFAVCASGILFLSGCTQSPPAEPAAAPTTESIDSTTVVDVPKVAPAAPEATAAATLDSAQAYLAKMKADLEGAAIQRDGVHAAIASSAEGRKAFPDDENLLRGSAALIYQSLQITDDQETMKSRQLELGKLARTLVERNKNNLEELGNMPSILLIEESKGYIASNNLPQAFKSLEDARTFGFDQSKIFYLDPSFQPMLDNAEYSKSIASWIGAETQTEFDAFESFPFEFTLKSLTSEKGEEVTLADFKGKPVIVDFWGTWCGPCRAALPHLVELHEKHKGELVVLGINFEEQAGATNYKEAKKVLGDFLKAEPLPYPCLYGSDDLPDQVPEFKGFPTMVFIGKDGKVQLSLTGYNPAPVLGAIVDKLMAM